MKQGTRTHLYPYLVILLAITLFSAGLGLKDPWPADEPRYALIAKEMVDSGQWLIPHRGGEPYPDKPPVFMWSIAAIYSLTGNMRIAHLLPSLIAGLIITLLTFDLGTRLWNRRTGFYAALVLITTIQFTLQAKTAQIDTLLTLWTTLGLYGFLRHLLLGPAWRWYFTAWATMGIGIITKGVGFLPILVFLPFLLGRWRGRSSLKIGYGGSILKWASGPVVMLLAISAWLVPMLITVHLSQDPGLAAYRDNILWHQTAQRYASAWHHIKPFWYFILNVIPLLWLPLTLLFPWLLPAWWRRLKRGDMRYLVLLGWGILVLLFFSLSPGKRGVYILPALPAIALATGPLLGGLWRRKVVQITATVTTLIISIVLLITALISGWIKPELGIKLLKQPLPEIWMLVMTVAGIGLITSWTLRRKGLLAIALFLWSTWLLYGWWGYKVLNPTRSSAPFMAMIGKHIGPETQLALVDWKEQLMLLADRPVKNFGFLKPIPEQAQAAARWLITGQDRWVLISERALQPCFLPSKAMLAGERHRRTWYLADRNALSDECAGL